MPRARRATNLTLLALTACAGASTAPANQASPNHATQAPGAHDDPRGLPGGIAPGVIAPHGTLLIGDVHGTREIPAFVARLVATLAAAQPVVLGLEIRAPLVPSLDGFLASDGGPAARAKVLRDPWWQAPYQDGRASVAMLELLDTVRALRAGGARVDVVCVDPGLPDGTAPAARDEGMAQSLIAVRTARPDAALVVYAGNYHTMRNGVAHIPDYEWMAMRLARAGVAFVSLNARYADGSSWICQTAVAAECGAQFMVGEGEERGIHLEASPDGNYDGWFGVGAITASPPAGLPALSVGLDAKLASLRDSPGARRARARRAQRAGQYARCAEEFGRIDPPRPSDSYNQACCLALGGNKDAAFERLRFAIDHGYTDLAGVEADADLASLHDDPRWPLAQNR